MLNKKGENMETLKLSDYLCPDYESGLYKGIPMKYRKHPKIQAILMTRLFTVRYRGTSKVGYDRPKDFIHKDYADTFAIYPYANYDEYQTKDDYLGLEKPKYDPIVRNYEDIREFRDMHIKLTKEVAEKIDSYDYVVV